MKKIHFLSLFLVLMLGSYAQQPTFTIVNNSYTSILCNTSTINLVATTNFTDFPLSYSWIGPNASYTGSNVNITQPGDYTVTAFNTANSASVTQTYSISVSTNTIPPVAQINGGNTFNLTITCNTPSLTLANSSTAGGPPGGPPTVVSVVSWNGPPPQVPAGAVAAYTAYTPGVYTLKVVKQSNGCTAQASAVISDGRIYPVFNAPPPFNLNCTTSTVTIYATSVGSNPGVQYNWVASASASLSAAGSASPVVNATGVYTLNATNQQSGCTSVVEVTVNPCAPTLSITNVTNAAVINCTTTSINLTATVLNYTAGTLTYSWASSTLTPLTGSNVTITQAGVYTVTANDIVNNFSASTQYTIGVNTVTPTVSSSSQPFMLFCGSATVAIYGLYTSPNPNDVYSWTKPAGAVVSALNTSTIVTNLPGMYVVSVTNTLSGCTASAQVMVAACIDGIYENKNNPVSISPNPHQGEFFIRGKDKVQGYLELYNVTGTLIKKQDLSAAETKISMAEYSNGVYFLHLFENGRPVKITKLVKE